MLNIIVISWNVKDLLCRCLESLEQATRDIPTQIFVIDNASSDGTVQAIKDRFSKINLRENKNNLGFPQAVNQALCENKGHVLLLNPDTIVNENTIKRLLHIFEINTNVGIVGPCIKYPDGKIQFECAREFPSVSALFYSMSLLKRFGKNHPIFSRQTMGYWDHLLPRKVNAVSGSCMLIREEAIKKVGNMDESLFMYFEDIDYCKRVQKAGWNVYYEPSAVVIHYSGQSSLKHPNRFGLETMQIQADWRFIKKYYSIGSRLLARTLLVTGSIFRMLIASFALPVYGSASKIITKYYSVAKMGLFD